ncbi:MAG: ABC transporter permease [Microbacterium sp.]
MTQLDAVALAEDRVADAIGHETAQRAPRGRVRARRFLARAIREPGYVLSWLVILVVAAFALFPSLFTAYDPLAVSAAEKLSAPSWAHPFGTDYIGRDLFSRVVYGTGLSLQATVLALALAFVASAVIGLLSGFLGGAVDAVLMRVIDVFLAIPNLLVSLLLITALGFGTFNIAIAVGVASVANFSRVMRAEVLKVTTSPFVEAARASGVRWPAILIQHVLPHARTPVLSLIALEFGAAILSIAALSFLGFGVALPAPEWGNLVAEGRNYLRAAWWLTLLPGAVIVATVVSANRVSRGISRRGAVHR